MNRRIYVFERSNYALDEIDTFDEEKCKKLVDSHKCDYFDSIKELVWHMNHDCIPPTDTLYLKTFFDSKHS